MLPFRPFVVGAALALAVPALAAGADVPAAARPADHRHGDGAAIRALLKQLALSADQQARVKSIRAALQPRVAALREAASQNRAALATTPPTDPSYPGLVGQSKADAAGAIQLRADAWSQIYAVLTPEQRAQVPALVAAARERAREREQRRARRGEMGPL